MGTMCTCEETDRRTQTCKASKLGPVERLWTQNGKPDSFIGALPSLGAVARVLLLPSGTVALDAESWDATASGTLNDLIVECRDEAKECTKAKERKTTFTILNLPSFDGPQL